MFCYMGWTHHLYPKDTFEVVIVLFPFVTMDFDMCVRAVLMLSPPIPW